MAVQNQRDTKSSTPVKASATKKYSSKASEMALKPAKAAYMNGSAIANTNAKQQQQAANGNGGGPRVSFNRDVHVKRIAKHPSETESFDGPSLNANLHKPQQTFQQLPSDLADINKEAALVLKQASSYNSKAENGENIPTFRVKTKVSGSGAKKFHSLPNRKKKGPAKQVARSVSDASSKKPATKRPSIFSLFSRKSDSNLNQATVDKDPRFEDSGGRRLVRSKSDVGSANREARRPKKAVKESKAGATAGSNKQLPTQLSPIIENAQKEDYFAEHFNRERRKSDAITEREKHESAVNELLENLPHTNGDTLLGKNNISNSIRDKILTLQAKSNENMHSSQLPAQKLPLTKGRTVNGMVKRLSMERFSPPPTITQPAFSYIRPNEGLHYAELEQQQQSSLQRVRSPTQDMLRTANDYGSQERESPARLNKPIAINAYNGASIDRTDHYQASQQNFKHSHVNGHFSPVTGATTIHITTSHSPSPWQQLSPRNLSDEDEGLGIETRKYYDDDMAHKRGSKSPAEPPIVPVIRNLTPPPHELLHNKNHYQRHHIARDDYVDDLGYRRQRLETRILTRRFGDALASNAERHDYQRQSSPERYRLQRYLSAEQDMPIAAHTTRFHKPQTAEILNKYSPERSHLDIISPNTVPHNKHSISTSNLTLPKMGEKPARFRHNKYYDEGSDEVREVYDSEAQRDLVDGYDAQHRRAYNSPERQPYNDHEPKSLDSHVTSNTEQYLYTPDGIKYYEASAERGATLKAQQQHTEHNNWQQSSLKRDKLQQRSFDKGDSGIENDFRKESFNGERTNRWRKHSVIDDIKACELFLRKEIRHTENVMREAYKRPANSSRYEQQQQHSFVYRERSIDDGSHYDPHLDKYSETTSTLRRRDQHAQTSQAQDSTLKRTHKKLGGFEKVKQLFTGSKDYKKDNSTLSHLRANSTTSSSGAGGGGGNSITTTITTTRTLPSDKATDKFMVREEEMRSRYQEHRPNAIVHNEVKATDISMRRRLSTPKASPLLLKRTSSDKTKKTSPLAKPEKMSWFKSLDRRAKSKSKEKLNVTVNGQSEKSSNMKRATNVASKRATSVPATAKNLRFFGDTDLDSNPPTISKANTKPKSRQTLPAASSANLNRSQKYSQSAHHLDRLNSSPKHEDYRHTLASQGRAQSRHKSTSLHNLNNEEGERDEVDFRSKRRHYSHSRDLDDISESASETDNQRKRNSAGGGAAMMNGTAHAGRAHSRDRLDRSQRYDDYTYQRSNDRQSSTPPQRAAAPGVAGGDAAGNGKRQQQQRRALLMGPPKPARSAERKLLSSYPRDRERFPAESSGTEGESSLQSQRSVVYLHATTVGAIPQPYHLRRRSISRDDLRSQKSKNQQREPPLQPMTRTVSRSVSMLAPWKPKHISEGYQINYSQEQNKNMTRTLPRHQHLNGTLNTSTNSLTRTPRNKSETPVRRFQNTSHD